MECCSQSTEMVTRSSVPLITIRTKRLGLSGKSWGSQSRSAGRIPSYYSRTIPEAQARAEQMHKAKIASLQKSIDKLQKMTFEEPKND